MFVKARLLNSSNSRRGGSGEEEGWGRLRRPCRGRASVALGAIATSQTYDVPLLGRSVTKYQFFTYIVQRPFHGIH
jgi:hypothetical protein